MNIKEKWKQYQYYAIIGVISLIALFFLPMIGSEAGLAWKVPTTVVGWIVYIVSKLLVAVINILIFHCFILQGKLNIQENSKYIEAQEILNSAKSKEVELPRSPSQYNKDIYGKKGLTIFATSLLSAVGLTQAVLTFDWISMLTYLFTVLMGIIFGILRKIGKCVPSMCLLFFIIMNRTRSSVMIILLWHRDGAIMVPIN